MVSREYLTPWSSNILPLPGAIEMWLRETGVLLWYGKDQWTSCVVEQMKQGLPMEGCSGICVL
jgi:hypothetical protein